MARNTFNVSISNSGLSAFRKEFKALVRDLRRVDGNKYTFTVEVREPSAGTTSQFREIPRSVIAEGLKRAHRDTKPQIYSDRLAAGGPFRQRVDAMADYLASFGRREVIRTRREGQKHFAEMDGRIFKTDTGNLGRSVSKATRANLDASLNRLFGKP